MGNRLTVLRDSAAALSRLRSARPDLILLDANLPWPGSRHLLAHIRAEADVADVPVILLVHSPVAEQILRAEGLPVQGYATKPVDVTCLVQVVGTQSQLGFTVFRADLRAG